MFSNMNCMVVHLVLAILAGTSSAAVAAGHHIERGMAIRGMSNSERLAIGLTPNPPVRKGTKAGKSSLC